ncbi:hypothetical protein HHK36_007821 [Tetracentron sinense]|uniref:Protein FAR1-RELATED SEQUENCE n=1 Tax=Tetracentron sinense TaxID=13715 RepID=A0A834ZDI7_TETSI|nr:hypothetical protein HHK36_007821 [Tetracentron sinense]
MSASSHCLLPPPPDMEDAHLRPSLLRENKDLTLAMGMKFRSYEDAREFYNRYALGVGFGTKIKSSWHRKKTKEKSRAAYGYFGDVVTFDTTYLTNRYDMSFAPFVGVNHHGQFVLLGMSTTQRSESMNSFFDGYVHAKTSLKEFVDQYDSALREKYEKEAQVDFESFYKNPVLKTRCYFEAQIAEIYTREMFMKFQDEVCGMVCCSKSVVKVDGPIITFSVNEHYW